MDNSPITHIRKQSRSEQKAIEFYVLLLEVEQDYANALKVDLETALPVEVIIVKTLAGAQRLLNAEPDKFFVSITSVLSIDLETFEKIDLLGEYNIPVIAVVSQYEDEMRDQLIKRHVIDYVVKNNFEDTSYICNLVIRIRKNISTKVLVVDDSRVSQFVIQRELVLQKFQVLTALCASDAMDVLAEHDDIKLVFVDQQMALQDGVSFVEQARLIYPKDQLLIIGISTSTDQRLAVKFLKAGANDFIAKPFNYEILLCRINQNLDMLETVEIAQRLSNIDFLSNVYNRRYFFERGEALYKSLPKNGALTAIMLDIDHFKKVNDTCGHDVGDQVIKHFAKSLTEHFGPDLIARLGGEEFAVLSLEPHNNNFDYIEAFRKKIASQTIQIREHSIQYSCSIGATTVNHNSLNNMLIHADQMLYKAKQSGRNKLVVEPNPE